MNPTVQHAFTQIHDSGHWDVGETRDGTGSTLRFTQQLISDLPDLFRRWHVTSILDAGCGEFHWMRHCDLSGITYVGGDVVAAKLATLRDRFPEHSWLDLDITEDAMPNVDLWLCRDTLIHLPDDMIRRSLRNFVSSGTRLLLVGHSELHGAGNDCIMELGDINHIDWYQAPWLMSKALDHIADFNRQLLLFDRLQIDEMLRRLPDDG